MRPRSDVLVQFLLPFLLISVFSVSAVPALLISSGRSVLMNTSTTKYGPIPWASLLARDICPAPTARGRQIRQADIAEVTGQLAGELAYGKSVVSVNHKTRWHALPGALLMPAQLPLAEPRQSTVRHRR